MKKIIFIILMLVSILSYSQFDGNGVFHIEYVTISNQDGIRLNDSSSVWDDIDFPFTTGTSGAVGYPTLIQDSGYYNFTVDTTGTSKCIMYFSGKQFKHSYKEGSNIFPHLHYKHTTTQGTPYFRMKYKWYKNGVSTNIGWQYYNMDITTGQTNNTLQVVYGSGIDGFGHDISDVLIFQVYLVSSSGNNTASCYQFDIHFEINSMGSKQELIK